MENRKGVILQAHMDMVPQKNNDTVHDFTKDPIETYIDGDWVKAKGTTLGAALRMMTLPISSTNDSKPKPFPKFTRNSVIFSMCPDGRGI